MVSNCPSTGLLNKALSGLVLHFGEGGPSSLPSEAAWLSMSSSFKVNPPEVRVFVSQSSLNTMKTVYAPLGDHIIVEPLTFSESELDAQAFLSMMAVGGSESAPLYIQVILVGNIYELAWFHKTNFGYRQYFETLVKIIRSETSCKNWNIGRQSSTPVNFLVWNNGCLYLLRSWPKTRKAAA